MSLAFAAVTPHPPVLIPNIGKEAAAKLEQTKNSLLKLEEELYLSRPHAIIIISPHSSLFPDAFSVNAHTQFVSNFAEFGDITTQKTWKGYPDLAARLGHGGNTKAIALRLVSEERVDYGVSVPLFFLANHLPDIKVLPIGYSHLDPKEHLAFGELLKECIMDTDKRIALIASGDLSHTLTKDSPAGYHPSGEKFDAAMIELLQARNTVGVASLDETLVAQAEQCGYRSILILLGVLKNMDFSFKTYSYEAPFGVGYLAGNFVF